MLHEALTGTTPHAEAATLGSLVVAICARPAKPVRTHAPHLGDAICAIVDRSLLLDPVARYATAEDLLADLRRLLPDGMTLDASMLDALPTNWSDDVNISGSDATALH